MQTFSLKGKMNSEIKQKSKKRESENAVSQKPRKEIISRRF